MKWFEGNIASAISTAKTWNAIFVVYCEGTDENSKQMTEWLNSDLVSTTLESKKFVSIKIQSDKEEYIQFAKIYQLVPVPSIFFIRNGTPVKIITGAVKSALELKDEIDKLNDDSDSSEILIQTERLSNIIPPSTSAVNPEIECEEGVCFKKPESSVAAEKIETAEEKEEKIRKAMKLIEQKRIERVEEERRLEKEREIQRRKEGQEMQNLRKWQEDQELKQIKEERMKEKMEAKAARQRVLEQIEQDKKERAQRFGSQSSPTEAKTSPAVASTPPSTSQTANTSRIQFKKPDGESEIVTFDSDMIFADVHAFVKNDILRGSTKDFALATTFPRKEFTQDDFDKTLTALGLIPSAVLLIIIKKTTSFQGPSSVLPTQTDGSFLAMIGALAVGLFSPIATLFTYLKNFILRKPQSSDEVNEAGKRKRNEETLAANDAAKKRNLKAFNNPPASGSSQSSTGAIPKTTGAYKRQTSSASSNVHRLHQDSDSEDDERKTWNGNSTQQM
ncbi:CLUMA_CG009510, isoform A [Clunio marinus]|uniref:UBX domain-containing protein 4 n=1 Tax=Clunio marinus TaxID=568069 RepID=A0A1J1I8N1_9DIPT|nr:CLUMA_CG009510, isoform A [Clunio marinus]